jgi:hypothetical protein
MLTGNRMPLLNAWSMGTTTRKETKGERESWLMAHAHGACNAVGDARAAHANHAAHAMHAYLLCPVQQGKPSHRTALLAHTEVASCGLSLCNAALAMLWCRCGTHN